MASQLQVSSNQDLYGSSILPTITMECQTFSGSLSTLLYSAKAHKVDLLSIPLYPLCEAYYAYLIERAGDEFESAAAALVALAYLLERKTLLLLPKPKVQEEHEEELQLPIPKVIEYGVVIESLQLWQEEREQYYFRSVGGHFERREVLPVSFNISIDQLASVFTDILNRTHPEPLGYLAIPRRSLSDQMKIVMAGLRDEWESIECLVGVDIDRTEAIWWFLALLELIRLGQARVRIEEEQVFFAKGEGLSG